MNREVEEGREGGRREGMNKVIIIEWILMLFVIKKIYFKDK